MTATAPRARASRLPRFARSTPIQVWLVVLIAVLLVAAVGPFVAPYTASEIVGLPYTAPSADAWLGTDYLGEDVFSRLLHGGWSVIGLGTSATLLGYAVGATIGLAAAYDRGTVDAVLMRAMDVLLAIPPILFLLVLATGAGSGPLIVVIGIAVIQMPSIARVVRAAALETVVRGYVEAATARGDRWYHILFREVLPTITGPVAADLGPRLTISILLVAGLNFLGLGLAPPTADWAVMIAENRSGIDLQPWAVLAPAIMIALLTVSTNVVADAVARSMGRSVDAGVVPR